ncbi:M16 family metallopeptidase [Halomonas llamarensis]|uniref:Insulinase family protein n=1 Tax=Halomonas llamarensis TaxID=2945104 RepID=A0ABT0SVA3_9GAMM|nr:insulinase family protein [Halomonas llamarensis]MCL7931385.1 insulinase family protein [Halomonas llamarensis]
MKLKIVSFIVLTASLLWGCAANQVESTSDEKKYTELPDHPDLIRHTLASGTDVLLLPKSGRDVELRLVVDAGSVHEAPHQRGMAHLIEHMVFQGTHGDPQGKALSQLAEDGVTLGSHVNAATSFFNTTYRLSLPNAKGLESAIHLLSDLVSSASFDVDALASEQQVVEEEWRLRQSGGTRINQQLSAFRYQSSLLARREPIGHLPDVLAFTRSDLLHFYRQWYRPDRMTLIVVGDFDPQTVMVQAKSDFAKARFNNSKRKETLPNHQRAAFPPAQKAPMLKKVLDPEQGQKFVQIMLQRPLPESMHSVNGQFRDLIDQLWLEILTHRFNQLVDQDELLRGQTSPFAQLLTPNFQHYLLILHPKKGDYAQAVDIGARELARLMQQPVLDSELHQAKQRLMNKRRDQVRFADAIPARRLADKFANGAVYQLPLLSEQQQFQLTEQLLADITPTHLRAALLELQQQAQVKIAAIGPDSDAERIDLSALETRWKTEFATEQPQWVSHTPEEVNLPRLEQAEFTERQRVDHLSSENSRTESVELSNGLTLLWRQDPQLDDQLQIDLRFAGGRSLEDPNKTAWVFWSLMLPEACGYGDWTASELMRFSRAHQIKVRPYVEELHHGFRANASPAQIEPLLQLLQLKMSKPRFCDQGLARWRKQLEQQALHQPVEQVFSQNIQSMAFSNGELLKSKTLLRGLDTIDLEALEGQRAKLFSKSSNGRVGLASRPLPKNLEVRLPAWLAALSTSNEPALDWRDRGVRPLHQSMAASWPLNLSPKVQVQIHFSQPAEWTPKKAITAELIEAWLHERLQTKLRHDLSGVYSFRMSHLLARDPEPFYLGRLNFSAAPERGDELIDAALEEIEKLRLNPPTAAQWQQAQKTWLLKREQRERQSYFWSAALARNTTPAQEKLLAQASSMGRRISPSDAHTLISSWLAGPARIFKLTPEEGEEEAK